MVPTLRMGFALALLAACAATAAERREVRNVPEFTAVSLSAPIKLELAQGDRDSVELEGDERGLADIETVVEDRTLKLRLKKKPFINWSYKVRAIVTARNIAALAVAGSGDIRTGKLEAKRVKVTIAGSGTATVWAKEKLTTSVVGSGDVRYYGDAAVETASVGSGSVKRLGAAPP
jgi:hypothetical protein